MDADSTEHPAPPDPHAAPLSYFEVENRSADPPVDDTLLQLTLTPGIGPRLLTALLEQFGSADAIRQQRPELLAGVPGISNRLANAILAPDDPGRRERVWRDLQASGGNLLTFDSEQYPSRLREIADAPPLLYVRGCPLPTDDLAIAIVGSRRCTQYGRRQAERLGAALARAGLTVISGLARGIDACAHRGALAAKGRTAAVLATGVTNIYPPEHDELASQISRQGFLLSELPPDQKPRRGVFPQRNRLISGLSLGVIVVEASRNSGALHTARHAMEQGRDVFAVPGPVDSPASEGTHDLIREGATLIRSVDDVLEELGPLTRPVAAEPGISVRDARELSLNAQEKEILNCLESELVHVDEILRSVQLDPSRVLSTLTVLEMKRFVRRLPGNHFTRR